MKFLSSYGKKTKYTYKKSNKKTKNNDEEQCEIKGDKIIIISDTIG